MGMNGTKQMVEETTNKREDYERRARECLQGLGGLMIEAKREGYSIESFASLGTDGEPNIRVAVLLR
jgi:hypothetical protein